MGNQNGFSYNQKVLEIEGEITRFNWRKRINFWFELAEDSKIEILL